MYLSVYIESGTQDKHNINISKYQQYLTILLDYELMIST